MKSYAYKNLKLIFLFTSIILTHISSIAQDDFIYEEGSKKDTIKSPAIRSSNVRKTVNRNTQTQNLQTPINSRVSETKSVPKSYYREFMDRMKIGAIIGLIITAVFICIVPKSAGYFMFIGFPIIWIICTFVSVFVSSC
jgi:hypothetical protein